MSVFNRISTLRRALAIIKVAEEPDPKKKDEPPKAGIQVTNKGDPKYGVYEHELGGQKIGHTVNVTGQGWTAVPAEGEIKGKFKKHMEAQQYLADNHVQNTKTKIIQEQAAAAPKVKKDDEGNQNGDATDSTESSEVAKAADIVAAIELLQKHQFTQFKSGGGKEPVKPEHQAAFEANKFKSTQTSEKD